MLSFTYGVAGNISSISIRRNKIMVWNRFMMLKKGKVDIYPFADKLIMCPFITQDSYQYK